VSSILAFCDQDDIWHPEKLLRVGKAFADSPEVVLVAHQARLVTADGAPVRGRMPFPTLPAQRYPLGTLPLQWYRGFSLSARRELLSSVSLDLSDDLAFVLAHDGWLWTIASCMGESVVLPDCLVSYRQHSANVIGARRRAIGERLHMSLEADADTYAYTSSSQARIAEALIRLGELWEEQGHNDRATAARLRSALFYKRAKAAQARESLYRSGNRRAAMTQLANLLRSGSYERRKSPLKDSLRIVLGPRLWRNLCACWPARRRALLRGKPSM
jgi:hypothetical protein